MKSHSLISLAAVGAITACHSCQQAPPNVLVILADDQGWGDLSINGNTSIQTPNIDRIAHEGIHMDNFYVCPVSAPTRAEFLSGRFAYRSGVVDVSEGLERMNPEVRTIGNVFQDAGYATALFGKWHNGTQYPYHPNARGFDEFYGFCSGHWGSYINSPLLDHNGAIVTGEGFLSDEITTRAMNYVAKSDKQPFFVVMAMNIPHSPMQVTDEWWDKWKDSDIAQKATDSINEDIDFTRAAMALNDNIDWNVGRMLDYLEKEGKLDNTIVIYLSDNGPNSNRWNGGMRGIKASVDEGGVRSALLMRWGKKLQAGNTIEQLSGAVDLLPTLASMCGVSHEINDLDGIDLSSYITGQKTTETPRNLLSVWGDKVGVRAGHYLLSNDNKLYNTATDRKQEQALSEQDAMYDSLMNIRNMYVADMNEHRSLYENRYYTVGHLNELYSRLPARDATFSGNIVRSNQYPNCSYLTNWTSTQDTIDWAVDVMHEGRFEVILYYTCEQEQLGSTLVCSMNNEALLTQKLNKAANAEVHAAEYDRVPRGESPMLNFKEWSMGEIQLESGLQHFQISASDVSNQSVMNLALVVFKRLD